MSDQNQAPNNEPKNVSFSMVALVLVVALAAVGSVFWVTSQIPPQDNHTRATNYPGIFSADQLVRKKDPWKVKAERLKRELKECQNKPPCKNGETCMVPPAKETKLVRPKDKPQEKQVTMDDSRQLTVGSKKKRVFRKKMSPTDEKRSLKNLSRAIRSMGDIDNNPMNKKMAPVKAPEPERHFLD